MKLYGLYKQATEGNVEGVMPRPMGFTMEDEGAKKKWDAWKREEGLLKTEAKRQYISYLIDTMRMYASGTHEARELLSELEFVWDQIKDLPYNPNEETHMPVPSHLPLFSQLDRFTNTTTPVPNPQYRDNLNRIYSHSRRSTAFSVNEYNTRMGGQEDAVNETGMSGVPKTSGPLSVFSLPQMEDVAGGIGFGYGNRGPTGARKSFTSGTNAAAAIGRAHSGNAGMAAMAASAVAAASAANAATAGAASVEEFKAWQAEINMAINKLMREISQRSSAAKNKPQLEPERRSPHNSGDDSAEYRNRLKMRLLHMTRILGWNILKVLQSFLFSVAALLFIAWCLKRNVVVNRTIVKLPSDLAAIQKKELVINLILETSENKWFIRLLALINRVVGFV